MSTLRIPTRLGSALLLGLLLGCGGGDGGFDIEWGWLGRWEFDTPAPCSNDVFFVSAEVIESPGELTLHLDFPAAEGCETRRLTLTGVETAPRTYDLANLGGASICRLEVAYGRPAAILIQNATFELGPDGRDFTLEGDVALVDGGDVYCNGRLLVLGAYGDAGDP